MNMRMYEGRLTSPTYVGVAEAAAWKIHLILRRLYELAGVDVSAPGVQKTFEVAEEAFRLIGGCGNLSFSLKTGENIEVEGMGKSTTTVVGPLLQGLSVGSVRRINQWGRMPLSACQEYAEEEGKAVAVLQDGRVLVFFRGGVKGLSDKGVVPKSLHFPSKALVPPKRVSLATIEGHVDYLIQLRALDGGKPLSREAIRRKIREVGFERFVMEEMSGDEP